jgi:flagellar motor switch protein FliN/FliY
VADGLSQEEIEKLLAGESVPADAAAEEPLDVEVEPEPALEIDPEPVAEARPSDAPLSPEEIAALIAGELGEEPAAAAPPPSAAPPATAASQSPTAPPPVVEQISYSELPAVLAPLEETADIQILMDVPLEITVELGQATRTIRELLEIGQGSILHLTRHAGEPVDVLVNGQYIARGEVVVIDENFGIRVTEVISPADRLRTMAAG